MRAGLRDMRYALPGRMGRLLPAPDAVRIGERLHRQGFATTLGYFQADDAALEDIVAVYRLAAGRLKSLPGDTYLSVKAPPLAFAATAIDTIARAADDAGCSITFDAHALKDADRTHDAAWRLLERYPDTGMVLPARWRRSVDDAHRWRDTAGRIRIVKGEWPDGATDEGDVAARYLELAAQLAGRGGIVAVATHDPALAERALGLLRDAGTPCELEQLRGLPRRRTTAIARRLGVPVRIYVPFGPGWWPYAINQALARPYLPLWAIRDGFARRG